MTKIVSGSLGTDVLDELVEYQKGLDKKTTFEVHLFTKAGDIVGSFGAFSLSPMPECCGLVVSTNSFVQDKYRGQNSQEFHWLKYKVAQALGYSSMIATVQLSNIPEVVGASKHGWKFVHTFLNKRTQHELGVMVQTC